MMILPPLNFTMSTSSTPQPQGSESVPTVDQLLAQAFGTLQASPELLNNTDLSHGLNLASVTPQQAILLGNQLASGFLNPDSGLVTASEPRASATSSALPNALNAVTPQQATTLVNQIAAPFLQSA